MFSSSAAKENPIRRRKPKSAADTGTWPPKLKNHHNVQPYASIERPKTANLERPSVLDPRLLKKLDMSLVCKEVLCDSVTRIQLGVKSRNSGGTPGVTACSTVSTRRRQSVPVGEKSFSSSQARKHQPAPFYEEDTEKSSILLPAGMNDNSTKRRSFEHLRSPEGMTGLAEISVDSPNTKRPPGSRQQAVRNGEAHLGNHFFIVNNSDK